MTTDTSQILKQALKLPAVDRANLADHLLSAHSGQFGHPFRSFRPPRSGATQDNLI